MAFDYNTIDLPAIIKRTYEVMSPKQREGVTLANSNKEGSATFDVWMGVGKTFMGLTAALLKRPQTVLVLCSKNATGTWISQREEWFPELADPSLHVIVRGEQWNRRLTWNKVKSNSGPLFYITTSGTFIRDVDWMIKEKIKFDVIICDEPHKYGLRNEKTKGWKGVKTLSDKKYYPRKLLLLQTGSLTTKGVVQLWPYLHLMNRKLFSSKWKFINMFTYVTDGVFGKVIGLPRNTEALAQLIAPYVFRVSKKDAESELPPLRRIKLWADPSPKLREMYNTMAEHLYMELPEGELISVANQLASYIKLRQLITCPAVFDESLGAGPIIEAICDKIQENDEIPHYKHNAIFTPFIPSFPHLKQHIMTELKMSSNDIIEFKGGMTTEELIAAENTYRKNRETIALISVKYAQSFNLETCLNPYFVHFEWDQTDNEQAEARCRRKSSDQSRTILSYYGAIKGSITEEMFDILNMKDQRTEMTFKDYHRVKEALKRRL